MIEIILLMSLVILLCYVIAQYKKNKYLHGITLSLILFYAISIFDSDYITYIVCLLIFSFVITIFAIYND